MALGFNSAIPPLREVWYVHGVPGEAVHPSLWATKLDAERYARECFPDEDPDTRYARIYFRDVNTYEGN